MNRKEDNRNMQLKVIYNWLIYVVLLLGCVIDTTAQDISHIRKKYTDVRNLIVSQKDEAQMQNNAILTLKHNVPGSGPQTVRYELYFTPYSDNMAGDKMQHKLIFVQSSYNIAARSFYEEFLYDESGNPIFIYTHEPDWEGKMDFLDRRMYYQNNKLLKMIKSEVTDGKSKVIYQGEEDKNQSEYLKNVFGRALSIGKMFDFINESVTPER